MREVGADLSRHQSKSLSEIPDIEYDSVATMGCGDRCPFVRAKQREDWNIPDPKEMCQACYERMLAEFLRAQQMKQVPSPAIGDAKPITLLDFPLLSIILP